MDYTEHRRRMLRGCLSMAVSQPEYAKWAAREYEKNSEGVLDGLYEKVCEAIARHEAEKAKRAGGIADDPSARGKA